MSVGWASVRDPLRGQGWFGRGKEEVGNRKGGYEPCKSYRHVQRRRDGATYLNLEITFGTTVKKLLDNAAVSNGGYSTMRPICTS